MSLPRYYEGDETMESGTREKAQTWQQPTTEERDVGSETAALLGDPSWVPGVWNQFPWYGAVGFASVFIGLIVTTVILAVSDGKRVKTWPNDEYPLTPNVCINLANQISNFGLVCAVGQGLAIVWWRRVMYGRSLRGLHHDYNYGVNFFSTITSGRRFNVVALAALMTKFSVIDSTLFQKATSTALKYSPNYDTADIQAWVSQKWPQGEGGISGEDGDIDSFTPRFADIINAFNVKLGNNKVHDTTILFSGCPPAQSCTGTMDALGFSYDCDLEVTNIDYGAQLQNGSLATDTSLPLWSVVFRPDWATKSKPYASINLTMAYINTIQGTNMSCPGTLTRRTCTIRPAVVRYPLLIQAADPGQAVNVTHLGFYNIPKTDYPFNFPFTTPQIDDLQVLSNTDLDEHYGEDSTTGGIAFALNNLFQSNVTLGVLSSGHWDLGVTTGSQAQVYFSANTSAQISQFCAYSLNSSATGVQDPFTSLLRDINSFGFVSSLYLSGAPGTPPKLRQKAGFPNHNFTTSVSGYNQQYETNYRFVVGAIAASIFSVLCVLPVYWGFWELGRKVTLEPFEIAQAMGAKLLTNVKTDNGYLDEVLDKVGHRKVQFGRLVKGEVGQLRIAEPGEVVMPHTEEEEDENKQSRRGMATLAVAGGAAGAVLGTFTN